MYGFEGVFNLNGIITESIARKVTHKRRIEGREGITHAGI